MAATKKSRPKPPPIDLDFHNLTTAKKALQWLKQQYDGDEDILYEEARMLASKFPTVFLFNVSDFAPKVEDARSLAQVSNYRVWKKDFAKTRGKEWWEITAHGAQGFLVRVDRESSEKEALESLENGEYLDDSDYYQLESETQDSDWKDYGRADLRRDIKRSASGEDGAAVEELIDNLPDAKFDEWYFEELSDRGDGPEMEGTSTIFPNVTSNWDGSLVGLITLLGADPDFGMVVTLAEAAFDHGKLVLRPQDLPEAVRALAHNPTPLRVKYDSELYASPYLNVQFNSEIGGEIPQQEDYGATQQMKLPGVEERRVQEAHETEESPELYGGSKEYFQFGAQTYDVGKAKDIILAKKKPPQIHDIEIAKVKPLIGMLRVNWNRIKADMSGDKDEVIDLAVPIILVTTKYGVLPIDGWHRIGKAILKNVETLPGIVLSKADTKKVEM